MSTRLFSCLLSAALLASGGCDECKDRPPPCADESLYQTMTTDGAGPIALGPATVVAAGTTVRLEMSETGEEEVFVLPTSTFLEPGDVAAVESVDAGVIVRRGGVDAFFVGTGGTAVGLYPNAEVPELETAPFCRQPPPASGECFGGTTVFALEVGDVSVPPGVTESVVLDDGRSATIRNVRANEGTSSCRGCLDLPFRAFDVQVVFE